MKLVDCPCGSREQKFESALSADFEISKGHKCSSIENCCVDSVLLALCFASHMLCVNVDERNSGEETNTSLRVHEIELKVVLIIVRIRSVNIDYER